MIECIVIKNEQLDLLITQLDEAVTFIKSKFNFELKSYEAMLRIALNAIQNDTFNNLLERLEINRELERGLNNAGGYAIDYLEEKNPKQIFHRILEYLKTNPLKEKKLTSYLSNQNTKAIAIVDNNDFESLKSKVRNGRIEILTHNQFKRIDPNNKLLVFHSFNGKKDFDFLYNHKSQITIIIYEQEYNLYLKHLTHRKQLIETEIKSDDRFGICGIKYIETENLNFSISTTIENIVNRLDDWGNNAYNGYKAECDILFEENEEKVYFKVKTNKGIFTLESNDTLFANNGDFIKTFKLKVGEKIRIYPKEQLAENLYLVAVETEPEIFGKVEEHSKLWKEQINLLKKKHNIEYLHSVLKSKGLKVLIATLESYGKGSRKFPMYSNDLRAIFKVAFTDKSDHEIDVILRPILKSKTTYNSTMIVLGRGLKQELKLFLKDKKVGEILEKRNFNKETMLTFIEQHMPLLEVLEKTPYQEHEYQNIIFPIEFV